MRKNHSILRTPIRGFTLVETLVAIAVLMVTITIPYYAIEHALTAAYVARDELIGTELAQEGIEFVRQVRDSNYIIGSSHWLSNFDGSAVGSVTSLGYDNGFANCYSNSNLCVIDSGAYFVKQCLDSGCTTLRDGTSGTPLYLSSSGLYNLSHSGTPTQFTRTLHIALIPSSATPTTATEAEVIVKVSWTTNHVPYSVQEVEYITNWLNI